MILDLLLASIVIALVILVGVWGYRATNTPSERFGANRQVHWLPLGASLAASSMSADTPLLIAGVVFTDGLAGNWFWWAGAPGVLATLFFFARLWRRSGVLTEVEIFRLRYGDGPTVQRYRMFRAVLDGIVLNVLVLASNGYAFSLVLNAMLTRWHRGYDPTVGSMLMAICFVTTAVYALFVGFRGLVKSDATEFFVAIAAGVALAVFAIAGLPGGLGGLQDLTTSRGGGSVFAVWPSEDTFGPLLLLSLGWWQIAPGKGMLIQRVAASRDERSAMLTVTTFVFLHFLLRPWGWYLIGAAALFYLPVASDPDNVMPTLAGTLLPDGLFGILLAVTALAFMGCVNSRMNLGASYMVNDVALVLQSRLPPSRMRWIEGSAVLFLTLAAIALVLGGMLTDIRALYQFMMTMLAGTGFVAIARWYWWRTSIRCEIASLVSAAVVACTALSVSDISDPAHFAIAVAINFLVGALVTVVVAFTFDPTPSPVLRAFNEKVSPGGAGWRHLGGDTTSNMRLVALQWVLANVALFSIVFACARSLALDFLDGGLFAVLGVLCLVVLRRLLRTQGASNESEPQRGPANLGEDTGNW